MAFGRSLRARFGSSDEFLEDLADAVPMPYVGAMMLRSEFPGVAFDELVALGRRRNVEHERNRKSTFERVVGGVTKAAPFVAGAVVIGKVLRSRGSGAAADSAKLGKPAASGLSKMLTAGVQSAGKSGGGLAGGASSAEARPGQASAVEASPRLMPFAIGAVVLAAVVGVALYVS